MLIVVWYVRIGQVWNSMGACLELEPDLRDGIGYSDYDVCIPAANRSVSIGDSFVLTGCRL